MEKGNRLEKMNYKIIQFEKVINMNEVKLNYILEKNRFQINNINRIISKKYPQFMITID